MAGKTIEATLRISGKVAEAIAALKDVRRELVATDKAATGAGSTRARVVAERSAAAEIQGAARDTARAQGLAAREAADAVKKAAADKRRAEREAAAEARRLAEDERKRRKAADDADRRERLEAERKDRATGNLQKNAQRQLPAQITDIVTGLYSGQALGTVAIQQGGQIFDSFGGVGNAIKGITALFTPMRLAIGGAALATAGFVQQIVAGYRESSQLNKAIALTGATAAAAATQIGAAATEVSAAQQTSVGFVRDVLSQLVTVSGQTDTTIKATASAATALAKLTGQSAEEAVKSFADQADGVTQWAVKNNRAYNFLTASQVQYIRTLEQQGRTAEAIKFTNEQLAATLEQRTVQALGIVERAWNAAGRAVSFFVEKIRSIGRDEGALEKLARLQAGLAEIDKRIAAGDTSKVSFEGITGTNERVRAAIQAQIGALNRQLLNSTEDAAAMRAEQDRIAKEGKQFQDLLAQQSEAAAQQTLARRLAALDAEQAAVESAYAREVLSANDRALKLNAIDQKRAQAQLALAEREVSIERGRTPSLESKADVEAQKARLTQLSTQVIQARTQLAGAVAEGRRLVDAEIARLDREIARRTADAARGNTARDVADPADRARQSAAAATFEARREFEDLERDISSRLATAQELGQSQALKDRLQQQLDLARAALDETTRLERQKSLYDQHAEQLDALRLKEEQIAAQAEAGALTTQQAENLKFEARSKAKTQLEQIVALLRQEASQAPAEVNAAAGAAASVASATKTIRDAELSVASSGKSALATFFNDIATGAKTGKEALLDMVRSFAQALLNLISQKLAEKAFAALNSGGSGSSSGGFAGWFASLFADVKHTGGVIGTGLGGATRAISPMLLAGAQVLHGGGLVAPNERVVVAEVGEEMLTADDPRHVNNLASLGGGLSVSFGDVVLNGAGGSEAEQRDAAADLQRRMMATVQAWAAQQQRQGGILAKGTGRG